MLKYNDRFIYVMQEFDDVLAQNIVKQLFELDSKNNHDIVLFINSNGGDCAALFAIYDAIKLIKSEVATVCMGRAYSAAACLLISGVKGKRFITKTSDIMFHELSSEVEGRLSSIKDEMVSIEHYDATLQRIAAQGLGVSYKKVLKRRKEAYYNANEALKIGAVDHVIESIDELIKHLKF